MKKDIRKEIAEARQERLNRLGATEGFTVPTTRQVPVVKFSANSGAPLLICEIKRSSPSKGAINPIIKASEQAKLYSSLGATHVSVLTEPDYFSGSLQDLIEVKQACPELAVLRKDFLLSVEDIEVSFRAGADACLLIASLLNVQVLSDMYYRCKKLGIEALVEVHSLEDVRKAQILTPDLVGINCRNLKDFTIAPLQPFKIRGCISWPCKVVYESGILKNTDGKFALDGGFNGLLVGEGVVKNPKLITELLKVQAWNKQTYHTALLPQNPWVKLYNRWSSTKPLVKICGITNKEDFTLAVRAGADLCGFILLSGKSASPRQVTPDFIRTLPPCAAVKVGVVVLEKNETLPDEIVALLKKGYLDMIQYHGEESPDMVLTKPYSACSYKALRLKNPQDVASLKKYYPKPCLIDAFSPHAAGGTGKRVEQELVRAVKEQGELWLAGGITPKNVGSLLRQFQPDLIDISSGLEAFPGKKDPNKIQQLFQEVMDHAYVS